MYYRHKLVGRRCAETLSGSLLSCVFTSRSFLKDTKPGFSCSRLSLREDFTKLTSGPQPERVKVLKEEQLTWLQLHDCRLFLNHPVLIHTLAPDNLLRHLIAYGAQATGHMEKCCL